MGIHYRDKTAFDDLYDENMEMVYTIAKHYSEDHHTAQDITQQVFMKLYMHMENINLNHVEAWLRMTTKHISINECKSISRRCKREKPVANIESEADKTIYLESLEDSFIEKLNTAARADLAVEIYAELYKKNKRWYDAMTITYILEKPQKEVAETMGVSLSVLQMMIYRAKKWIKRKYQKEFDHLNEA